jgi:2',3'-cyclic-nucleotide 3'-phosphodiesterase
MNIGTALWLMPKKHSPLYDALHNITDGLKPLFDDGHTFEPHVTITTNISVSNQAQVDEILNRALAASRAVPAINVVFTGLSYGSQFFKKVYFTVEPNAELVSLARICREEFVTTPKAVSSEKHYAALPPQDRQNIADRALREAAEWVRTEYDPHLSLVYSDSYPVDEASQRTIDTRLSDVFGNEYATKGLGWTNGRLQLVRCEGPVEEWEVLGYRDIN